MKQKVLKTDVHGAAASNAIADDAWYRRVLRELVSALQYGAGSIRRSAGATRQARATHQTSQLDCDDLLQNISIQTEIRDQSLRLAALLAKLD